MKRNDYNQLKIKWILLLPAFLLVCGVAFAQASTVTGVVKTAGDLESIPGASVLIKGTARGMTTDLDGEFSIQASPGEVLQISFIGYATQEITVEANMSALEVILQSSTSDLEEVVVVGYG